MLELEPVKQGLVEINFVLMFLYSKTELAMNEQVRKRID